jgi:hypothetical protein
MRLNCLYLILKIIRFFFLGRSQQESLDFRIDLIDSVVE